MAEVDLVKVTIELPRSELEQLEELAAEQRTTPLEALRRALGTERFLRSKIKDGDKVLLRKQDHTYREVVLP